MNRPTDNLNDRRHLLLHGVKMCAACWLLCLAGSGCSTVFSKPVMSSNQPGLPWLAGFTPAPVEMAPPFDLTQIQPARRLGTGPDDLLEITIWDLYEPGKPHTFPSRVDSQGQIVVPHLEGVLVSGQTPAEIEAKLSHAYRRQEILKQPRILVRELAAANIHTYVTGAVLRPGLINLPRQDSSVFAALVAAGGLSRNAGLQVYVSEQASAKPPEATTAANLPAAVPAAVVAGNTGMQLPQPAVPVLDSADTPPPSQQSVSDDISGTPPLQQMVNHSQSVTVSTEGHSNPDIAKTANAAANPSGIEIAVATRPDRPTKPQPQSQPGHWYDLTVEHDRQALKELVLRDGDVVTVRPAAPPVRISGAVTQPGAYRAPANNSLALQDAILLAGGFGTSDLPMVVVVTRPANAEHGLERWTFRMGHGEKLPLNAPNIEPGDLIHVEPTAQARVQSLVGSLWPSK